MKFNKFIHTGLLMLLALLSSGPLCTAKVYYVDLDFQGENSTGVSWLSAFPSIQHAVDKAAAEGGGEIWVKAGVYTPRGKDRTATFKLKPNTRLFGGFRGHEINRSEANPKANRTILSGDIGRISSRIDNCYHVVTGGAHSSMNGFIIVAGNANGVKKDDSGGGLVIRTAAKNFTALNCTFEKNNGTYGGALYTEAAGTILSNCTFFSNSAQQGGAITVGKGGRINITGSTFSSSYSKQTGGALSLLDGSSATISDSWFLYNTTEGTGGAISSIAKENKGIELKLTNSTFRENSAAGTGGALFNQGPISPLVNDCQFIKNRSTNGAGVMENRNGVKAVWKGCTLTRNRSATEMKDIENDNQSLIDDGTTIVMETERKTTPTEKQIPKIKRKLEDVYVVNNGSVKIKLRSVVAKGKYTVIATGDLTDPVFLSSYRKLEAVARNYSSPEVNFLYIYRYLAHPENHGYVQPFNMMERTRHMQLAVKKLHTQIPWICDSMENESAAALELNGNTLFIFNKEGIEEFAGKMNEFGTFRTALNRLASRTSKPTNLNSIPHSELSPLNLPIARFTKRIKINPTKTRYEALRLKPLISRQPFYVKMRVEASNQLLKTGNGRLYLGFHIDPIYNVQWNNMGNVLNYAIEVPRGTAISPSINQAEKVTQKANDTEPREFLLEARKWNRTHPISITVNYSVYNASSKRNISVSQKYLIYRDRDPFGGAVIGRAVTEQEVFRKGRNP